MPRAASTPERPRAMPMSSRTQQRRVIDSIADHCDDQPRALQLSDQLQFLPRRDPGEYPREIAINVRYGLELFELAGLYNRRRTAVRKAQLDRYCSCRGPLVPVSMMLVTPARRNVPIRFDAPFRIWSAMPTRPAQMKFCSTLVPPSSTPVVR